MFSLYPIKTIKDLAVKHEYRLKQHQKDIGLLIFVKPGVQVNVYTTKMTVSTCLEHPKQGKTQLFRRSIDLKQLEAIFEKPRVHANEIKSAVGYRRKKKSK